MTSAVSESGARTVGVSKAMLLQKAADLVASNRPERALVLRAKPEWTGGDLKVGNRIVRVVLGVSQLGILDFLTAMAPHEYAIILTDRVRNDLGNAVLSRAYKNDIQMPDEWQAIPRLFDANEVSRELRRLDWAATALLDYQPVGGWPRTAEVAVSDTFAIASLLNAILGIDLSTELDSTVLMSELGRGEVRSRWASTDPSLRRHLIAWAEAGIGTSGALALNIAQKTEFVAPLAVSLALDVLWPDDGSVADEEQVAARVRIERHTGESPMRVDAAKAAARIAKAIIQRAGSEGGSGVTVALKQAEALLTDIGWTAGAERSTVLWPGYRARVRALATALGGSGDVEEALVAVHRHRDRGASMAPDMAVRLHRWLAIPEPTTAVLSDDIDLQTRDGAWVDAALGAIWSGSDDPAVTSAYFSLAQKVVARRAVRDGQAAARLSQALTNGPAATLGESAIGIERILGDVVAPWRIGGVLLIVLDGLSSAVATSLAAEVSRVGLVEFVPDTTKRRFCAVTALPSLTSISRTSLFCGRITKGTGEDERRGLRAAFPGSQTFHKAGLRAPGGATLPSEVVEAITADQQSVPVVGVVINAIDDAIHKNDVSDWEWGFEQLSPLRALLDAAVNARRTVVITSDHGHVVERSSEALTAERAEARWRSAGAPVTAGEVLVSGPRVVEQSGSAVLLWREDAHFGPRRAGYHGGASLAEVAVPVLVFQPATALAVAADGWIQAPPQTPDWWHDPVFVAPVVSTPKPKTRRKAAPVDDNDGLFTLNEAQLAPDPAPEADLVVMLVTSGTYASQRAMAGRRALPDSQVRAFVRAIVDRGFRAHRDTVAVAVGVPTNAIGQVLAAVKRLLNVDGYDVLSVDHDGVTYKIDAVLLRDQFRLGGR
ncbi:BREX-2 system phosphatase PglZ [Pseudoclavibacter helvolus]|uniref:BREX-2 system phosphatase PglZ n=1 Tax=Pseudoclavibacter helvolus TaxID=255205 RepID=UPI0037366CFF